MSYAKKIKSKAEFIGKLTFAKDQIKFVTTQASSSGRIKTKYFRTLGDVVYFFFVGKKLMKIGKAAGKSGTGWYQRSQEYTKKRYNKNGKETWDPTTRKIYNYMIDNRHSSLDVYAIQSPRIVMEINSLITGLPCTVEIETAEDNEQLIIQEAMMHGEDLPFCREVMR